MSPVGRRPGNVDTREEIIQAARSVFADRGYEGTSLRAVARQAGVDAALVHHYFDGKAALFIAAMALPFDPRSVKDTADAGGETAAAGARVVEGFLTMWDWAEGTGSSFTSCVAAMAASTSVADAMREFVNERVGTAGAHPHADDNAMNQRRHALVSSQLMGLAFTRYVLRVPPVSTATPQEIGQWAGPTLDRYFHDNLDESAA